MRALATALFVFLTALVAVAPGFSEAASRPRKKPAGTTGSKQTAPPTPSTAPAKPPDTPPPSADPDPPFPEDARTGELWEDPTTGMEFVFVQGGSFEMGDTMDDGDPDEQPVHPVTVRSFRLGRTEVTVGQFRRFAEESGYRTDAEREGWANGWNGANWTRVDGTSWRDTGFPQGEDHPVVAVSWNDVMEFARWFSKKTGRKARLPTEAEWEYAARGGTKGRTYWGSGVEACGYANVADQAARKEMAGWPIRGCDDGVVYTAPVARYQPNAFGLFDMMGNAWEWCQDWYGETYYKTSQALSPQGPPTGLYRVLRGGSWGIGPRDVRSASRHATAPGGRFTNMGFRLLLAP